MLAGAAVGAVVNAFATVLTVWNSEASTPAAFALGVPCAAVAGAGLALGGSKPGTIGRGVIYGAGLLTAVFVGEYLSSEARRAQGSP